MLESRLTRDQAEQVAALHAALADAGRVQILDLIYQRGESYVVELVEVLGSLQQPTVSHHVRLLVAAGLVERERNGVFVRLTLTGAGEAVVKQFRGARW